MIQAWMGTEVYRGSHLAIGHRQIAFSISWSSDATLESNRTATASMLPLKFIIGKVYLVINLLLCGGVQQKHKITLKVYNCTQSYSGNRRSEANNLVLKQDILYSFRWQGKNIKQHVMHMYWTVTYQDLVCSLVHIYKG